MLFRLHVADRETGDEQAIELEAPTVQQARQTASDAGFVVESVSVLTAPTARQIDLATPHNAPDKPGEPNALAVHPLACPKCHSAETRKVSVVYAEQTGTSQHNGKLKTTEVSIHNGIGIGFGSGNLTMSGNQQSDLAKQLAPPKPHGAVMSPIGIVVMLGSILCSLTVIIASPFWYGISGTTCVSIAVATVALAVVGGITIAIEEKSEASRAQIRSDNEQMARWNRRYWCGRCGNIFLPDVPEQAK